MRKRHFRWRLNRKWPALLLALLLLSGGTAGAYYLSTGRSPVAMVTGGAPTGRINVLLMGTDARQGEPSQRTDTMILVSIDPATKQASLLSIPRDTRIDLPGHPGDKINDADVYGGPQEAMSVVGGLLGVNIQYYVLTNFVGFKDIVDTLGGLTVDVPYDMYHYDPMDGGIYTINLKKGVQHLDGTEALEYVRFRDDPTGDIARTKRQQTFLVALLKKMMQPSSLTKLPTLMGEVWGNVQTNLPLTEVLSLVHLIPDMKGLQVVNQTLPGYFETVDGVSYWGVDPGQAKQVAAQILGGQPTGQVVETPPAGVSQVTYTPPPAVGVTAQTYGKSADTQKSATGQATTGVQGSTTPPAAPDGVKITMPAGASVTFTKEPDATTTGSGAAGG